MYSQAQQLLIEYFTLFNKGLVTIDYQKGVISKVSRNLYILQLIAKEPSDLFTELATESITNYFQKQSYYFIIVFVIFIFITSILLFAFIISK
jgi:hypothetical protein